MCEFSFYLFVLFFFVFVFVFCGFSFFCHFLLVFNLLFVKINKSIYIYKVSDILDTYERGIDRAEIRQ